MKRLILLFLLLAATAFTQKIGFQDIDERDLAPWTTANSKHYISVYHFGESEMESDLIVIEAEEQWYAQIKFGNWNDAGNEWIPSWRNLNEVKVKGNDFISQQTRGEFVIYNKNGEQPKGLKIFKPWSGVTDPGEYEVGLQSYDAKDYFTGEYPQASLSELKASDLKNLPRQQLQIMRNEIFARYGYKFKPGGSMEAHFKQQSWYRPLYNDVNSFLTGLEKKNIKTIRAVESSK